MEKFIYEAKPYFYMFAALFALVAGKGSTLMTISGVLIGICGVSVALLRYDSRQMAYANKKNKSSANDRQNHYGHKTYRID